MGAKSEEKKKLILEAAREVFSQKGYRSVTMKDIVEACNISRGGLYLYYSSVEEIFQDVLSLSDDDDSNIEKSVSRDSSASDMLAIFIKEQKKEILRKKNSLTFALYEYYFENRFSMEQNMLRKQFDVAVRIVEKLVMSGIASGEFVCSDPEGFARNMMYMIEGLKISGCTSGVSEEMVDRELLFAIHRLLPEE